MKKIDFHIHTRSTCSDAAFHFSIDKLKAYVSDAQLDAIAITNHNMFDAMQFESISDAVPAIVFPGIEINLCKCHLLLIANRDALDDFATACSKVESAISRATDNISVAQLKRFFGNLGDYLLIPHVGKKPAADAAMLHELSSYVEAGEVNSAKKFVRAIKDEHQLPPVIFSDARMHSELAALPTRQTFVDCGDLTLSAIKTCLKDKTKVALSLTEGNKLFQVLPCGQMISTGLNVLLGLRSSGKSHTLNEIAKSQDNVKYIPQFSLLEQNASNDEKQFKTEVEQRRSYCADNYLSKFKSATEDILKIDVGVNDREVEKYISSLLQSAVQSERNDAFSKSSMFNETRFTVSSHDSLQKLISSMRQVVENLDHRELIEQYADIRNLKTLVCKLIEELWSRKLKDKKKQLVNELVSDIKDRLKIRSSARQTEDVDLYRIALDNRKIAKFEEIATGLQRAGNISNERVQGFRVVADKGRYERVSEVKNASGTQVAFSGAFEQYGRPYAYLQSLKQLEGVAESDLYKFFAKVTFKILNKDGFEVSGGERSEFRLLQEIKDAQTYDILLIDEPESSFDNLFLNSEVNGMLREIAATMPVVVATHNSTVGASISADYLLYTQKNVDNGSVCYRVFSGHPSDRELVAADGVKIATRDVVLDSLEAGEYAYNERGQKYEDIKN